MTKRRVEYVVKCANCGVEKVLHDKAKARRNKFCSRECAGCATKKPYLNCALCGKPTKERGRLYCSVVCSTRDTAKYRGRLVAKWYEENPEAVRERNQKQSATKQRRLLEDPEYASHLRSIGERCRGQLISRASIEKRLKTIRERYTKGQQLEWSSKGGKAAAIGGAWNKGLTKETDTRVARQASSLVGHKPNHGSGRGRSGFRKDLGLYVRSTWEADLVRVFRHLSIPFEYEPKVFSLLLPGGGEGSYRPDFYLPALDLWVEVSGWVSPQKEQKVGLFLEQWRPRFFHVTRDTYVGLADRFSGLGGWEGTPRGPGDASLFLNLLTEA